MVVMWELLLALPSPTRIEKIVITVGPKDEFKDTWVQELKAFPWIETVDRLKRTLTNLKTFVIGVGTYKGSCASTYLDRLRAIGGIKEREEAGLLRLKLIHWEAQSAWDELPWRQITGRGTVSR
ncbi:hypothetical protein AX15_004451 [Amanita polypyramis BW_CC]|nr:hypothetical protein AX15_004451 [Amanita polypyramis BW_CC]